MTELQQVGDRCTECKRHIDIHYIEMSLPHGAMSVMVWRYECDCGHSNYGVTR